MIDVNTLKQLIETAAWASPLVLGVVQLIKTTFPNLDKRFVPLIASLAGVLVSLFVIQFSLAGGIVGFILGLSSTGLYEFGKNVIVNK